MKTENPYSQQSEYMMNDDLNGIEEEPFDEYGNTLKETDLAQLNQNHAAYASEIEEIKQMLSWVLYKYLV